MDASEPPRRMTTQERADRARRAAQDGEVARRDYEATAAQQDVNTARLRALRLERDRLEAETAAAIPAKAPKAAAVKRVRRNIPVR